MASNISIRNEFPRPIQIIEHQIIRMPDGCELSARIWLPQDAATSPVPAIIEHLPYRKRDGTIVRDCMNHPWFAGHGYACIRVDMRGNGDSQGLMADEYTAQELQDACDVITWATQQPWCTESVGMMGISWGGFNALQVASLRPDALKAVVTACSTVDRFADDIHFKGGCLLGENIGWAANMLSYSSRPPDPLLVGDQWRDLWLSRLENMPFLAVPWLDTQERNAYWKHGSVCEDYASISAAVLSIGGWHDGYRNTISHLVENLQAPVKGIVGPWIHKYPHYAAPGPRIGFLQESLKWWDRWLKDIDNGAESEPNYRAYLMDGLPPAPWYDERPGRWIAEDVWPSESITVQTFRAHQSETGVQSLLANSSSDDVASLQVEINSPANCGAQTGEYFPFTFGPELPDDQQSDDRMSCCFDSATTDSAIDIVGAPVLRFTCFANKPLAHLTVRLCDVLPDGRSTLITIGMLNLTHANSHEHPKQLIPGETIKASLALDQIAYRLPKGHKLRIAISTHYWPFLWPSPEDATVTLKTAFLELPVRPSASGDECVFEEPETAAAWPHEVIREARSTRDRLVDPDTGVCNTRIHNDFGENRDLDHQLVSGSWVTENFSIHPNNPLSALVDIEWEQTLSRDDWKIRTHAAMRMHSDEDWFYISGSLTAWEDDQIAFERAYDEKVKRRFI